MEKKRKQCNCLLQHVVRCFPARLRVGLPTDSAYIMIGVRGFAFRSAFKNNKENSL